MVPVVQDALLQIDDASTDAAPPDLPKDHGVGHGVVGNAARQPLQILVGVVRPGGVGDGRVEAEQDEEVPGLRPHDVQVRVVPAVDHVHVQPHLGDVFRHHDDTFPLRLDG